MRSLVGAIQSNMKGMSMSIKATEQPTFPFLFAARNFAASTHTEHLVLFYLISRLKDGTCFPKQTLIAHELRYTVRAIQDNIASLEESVRQDRTQ
jgi:DNA-binding MarR family transcriptional regulator